MREIPVRLLRFAVDLKLLFEMSIQCSERVEFLLLNPRMQPLHRCPGGGICSKETGPHVSRECKCDESYPPLSCHRC